MFGSPEVLIIGVVVMVLFGAAAIPKFARSIGRARRELQLGGETSEAAAPQTATPGADPLAEREGAREP